jgi:hypothetical protein
MSWQAEERAYLEGRRREDEAAMQDALGEFVGSLRKWSVFGGLTVDHRRRKLEHVETRSPAIAEWEGELGAGFVPVVWGGSVVKYSHRLDEPRPLPRDMIVRMVEQAMQGAEKLLRRHLDWVVGIEPHKSGDLHAHCVVYTGQVGEGRNDIRALHAGWFTRAGYCKLSEPRDNVACSVYTSKYVCKPGGELILSSRLHLPAGPLVRRFSVGR